MDNKWFVNFRLHNKEKDEWSFKNDTIHSTYEDALKAYHSALSTYIDYGSLDFVFVSMEDRYGNRKQEWWEKPQPEPEPDTET